jgi:hypothetical protein
VSVLHSIPARDRLEAVLMLREGMGWAVGIGCLVAGRIERERSAHMGEREAQAAALDLSDRFDLIVVRS